ncbi:hypothetical protein ACJX0J_007809, partial [Zea mays]
STVLWFISLPGNNKINFEIVFKHENNTVILLSLVPRKFNNYGYITATIGTRYTTIYE